MATVIDGSGSAATLRFAIVQSRFNETVTKRLLEGAMEALRAGGAKDDAIEVVSVPGAFEIPLIAARLAKTRRYDAVVCLGAVIRGQTPHFEYISAAVSQGIARVAYDYGVPVIFGILTTDTEEQADVRSGGATAGDRCNRGADAGRAAIEMANLMKRLDTVRGEPVEPPPGHRRKRRSSRASGRTRRRKRP
jgi:6,7-dimethyl-8-ribityllumazine synthase